MTYEEQPDGTLIRQPDAPSHAVWLLEAPGESPPKWLRGGVLPSWTTEAVQALRFQTQGDARAYVARDPLLHGRCWPIEHLFIDMPLCGCESPRQCRGAAWAARDGMRCSQASGGAGE